MKLREKLDPENFDKLKRIAENNNMSKATVLNRILEDTYIDPDYNNEELPLLLIEGESAAGKDTLAQILSIKHYLRPVCSYATRPMREGEKDGLQHKFITKEQADKIKAEKEIAAYTEIDNYEYFTTMEDIDSSDIYVIDPNGIDFFKKKYPDKNVFVIYVTASEETRTERAKLRGDKKTTIKSRFEDERKQFENLHNYDIMFTNDGSPEMLEKFADIIMDRRLNMRYKNVF